MSGAVVEEAMSSRCATSGAAPACWVVDAREEGDAAAGLAPYVLDAEERERAAAFVREADRRCYLTAHVALRLLLGARLGITAAAVELTRERCPTCGGPHGRPAVPGGGTHFSLSHGGFLALIALASAPVGVDVEEVPARDVVEETAKALHPAEAAELAALPAAERPVAFGRAWVRKEAYLKGLGTGLSRSPDLDYLGTAATPAVAPDGWSLMDVAAPAGYVAATAVQLTESGAGAADAAHG